VILQPISHVHLIPLANNFYSKIACKNSSLISTQRYLNKLLQAGTRGTMQNVKEAYHSFFQCLLQLAQHYSLSFGSQNLHKVQRVHGLQSKQHVFGRVSICQWFANKGDKYLKNISNIFILQM
jgi:hypothetical protein